MRQLRWRTAQLNRCYRQSGGTLQIPRTPVERIVLYAKLKRLKRDAEQRREMAA